MASVAPLPGTAPDLPAATIRPRRRRLLVRLGLFAAVALLLIGAVLLVVWFTAAPYLAAWYAAAQLRSAGIPVQSLTIDRLGTRGLQATNIRLGEDAVAIGDLQVRFSLRRLLDTGQVDRIEIRDARLRAVLGDQGVMLPGIPLDEGGGDAPTALPILPVDEIAFIDSTVVLDMPQGTLTLPANLIIDPQEDGGAILRGVARPQHDWGRAQVPFGLRITPAGGFAGNVQVEEADIAVAGVAAHGIAGELAVSGTFAGLDSVAGDLTVAQLDFAGVALTDLDLAVSSDGNAAGLVLTASTPDAGVEGRLAAEITDLAGDPHFTIDAHLAAAELGGVAPVAERGVSGRAVVDLALSGPVRPWLVVPPTADATATGRLAVDLKDLRVPSIEQGLDVEIATGISATGGEVWLTGEAPWRLAAAPTALGPVAVTVAADPSGAPQRLLLAYGPDGGRAGLAGAVTASLGDTDVSGVILATGAMDADGHLALAVPEAEITATPFVLDGLSLTPRRLRVGFAGSLDAFTATVAAEIGAEGALPGGGTISGGAVSFAGGLRLAAGLLTVDAADCVSVSAAALSVGPLAAPTGLSGCIEAAADRPLLQAALDGSSVAVEAGRVSSTPILLDELAVEPRAVRLSARRDGDDLTAEMTGTFGLEGEAPGGIGIEGGAATLSATMRMRDGDIELATRHCFDITAARLRLSTTVATRGDVAACLQPTAQGLRLQISDDGRVALTGGLAVENLVLPLSVGSGAGTALDLSLARLELAAAPADPALGPAIGITATGGRVNVAGIAVEGIDLTGVLPGGRSPGSADIRIARITGPSLPVVPLAASLTATLDAAGQARLDGEARSADGALIFAVDGRHDGDSGRGEVRATLTPVTLAAETRELADLAPFMADAPLRVIGGTVDGSAFAAWNGDVTTGAEIWLTDGAVTTPVASLTGVDATLVASSLVPLILPLGQRLTADTIEAGIVLEEGEVFFGLSDTDLLEVASLQAYWAGGRLHAEPFVTRLADTERAVALHAQRVDLGELLAQVPVDHLSATGKLSGRLPFRLAADTIIVDNAVLEAEGPGVIRYAPEEDPAAAQEQGVALLMEELRDFRYESLTMTLNGRTGQDLQVGLQIQGANPTVYDGYPVALSVNVTGALDQILRSSIETSQYDQRLQELFREGAEGAVERTTGPDE